MSWAPKCASHCSYPECGDLWACRCTERDSCERCRNLRKNNPRPAPPAPEVAPEPAKGEAERLREAIFATPCQGCRAPAGQPCIKDPEVCMVRLHQRATSGGG